MSSAKFLREFSRNWRGIGAITPSSRFLVEKMLSKVDFSSAKLVVELGPGTGVLTKRVLDNLRPSARLVVLETNESFCLSLRSMNDQRLSVACISAEKLSEVLDGDRADVVFSGIPFASLGRNVSGKILDAVKESLSPKGIFVQFQYSQLSRHMIEARFGNVDVDFVPLNIPPAFVYTAQH